MRQITTPRELRSLRSKGIVEIVAGGWSFHALDRCGRVWMWGWVNKHLKIYSMASVAEQKYPFNTFRQYI